MPNTPPTSLLSLKTVIRTKDFQASKSFYKEILNLEIIEEYDDNNGSKGIIFRLGETGSNAYIEISEIKEQHDFFEAAFVDGFLSNKAGIQIRTDNMVYWAERIKRKWEARGPILRPWGSLYLYLKDPDNLHIIIYQEKGA